MHENAFENVVCEMAAILSGGRWVNIIPYVCPVDSSSLVQGSYQSGDIVSLNLTRVCMYLYHMLERKTGHI